MVLEKSHEYQRFFAPKQIETIMSKNVLEYACIEKVLDSSFNNKYGGIHVLVAPSGSGKSSRMLIALLTRVGVFNILPVR